MKQHSEQEKISNLKTTEREYKEKVRDTKAELKKEKEKMRELYTLNNKIAAAKSNFFESAKLFIEWFKEKITAKLFFGVSMLFIGFIKVSFPQSESKSDVIGPFLDVILGTLLITLAIGLIVLYYSEKNNEETKKDVDSINTFIGKQLFEKGLYGLVIGVVVGSLTMLIELAKS